MADNGVPENAYEKLSREVHQMQITGAIHNDWLENPKGFLLKPDFKRKLQLFGAGGKRLQTSTRGLRIHLPGNAYRKRWFVLDGMILRYFKNDLEDQELGAIHLTSVNAVLPSSLGDAPDHALDLVCADRIYTVAGTNREDMVRWATVLTLVLRGEYKPKLMQRPESTIIRGSSVIPRPSAIARKTAQLQNLRHTDVNGLRNPDDGSEQKILEDDLKERIITITFEELGSLLLNLRGTVEGEVVVSGFQQGHAGQVGPAERTGAIKIGDVLISVNNYFFTNIELNQAVELINSSERPLTLRFSRIDSGSIADVNRIAEGWILAKEPAAHRYRIRMLQLSGYYLKLYKPSIQNGKSDQPCLVMKMEDITDIRPIKDSLDIVSASTQYHPKRWGITLQGSQNIFTFYTKNNSEMSQWIDALKNSTILRSKGTLSCIPTHPLATVDHNSLLKPGILIQEDLLKRADLRNFFYKLNFVLYEDGRIEYFLNQDTLHGQRKAIGMIRCDTIISIVPCHFGEGEHSLEESQEGTPWQLELGVTVSTALEKWKKLVILSFKHQDRMIKWAIMIAREAKRATGQHFELSVVRRFSRKNGQLCDLPVVHSDLSCEKIEKERSKHTTLFRGLKDVVTNGASKDWFFVKKPSAFGVEAYHPRFVVLNEYNLFFFKYKMEVDDATDYASTLDLRSVKDVREPDLSSQEALDYSIQLVTSGDVIWTMVADSYEQKERWLTTLIWLTDYYYRSGYEATTHDRQDDDNTIKEVDSKSEIIKETEPSTSVCVLEVDKDFFVSENCTEIRGWLQVGGRQVFATIMNNVFSYYEKREDYDEEWGDAIGYLMLNKLQDVHSDEVNDGAFNVKILGESGVQVIAENGRMAKKWMLVMCCCAGLILKNIPSLDSWASQPPKEAWIWKLDRLYQVFRRRYFSLRNHELVFLTNQGGRPLGMVSLPCVFRLVMSKVCTRSEDEADFYQLEMSFAIPSEEKARDDQVGDFYALSLAFDTESDLKDWANSIYDCCTNSMSLKASSDLPPLSTVQVLPKVLLKTSRFVPDRQAFNNPTIIRKKNRDNNHSDFCSRGWLYYRTSTEERIRLRYFVQWGYELSIYKHEILPDEQGAIRYGVIDCRVLTDVRFAYINSPENAVELLLTSDVSVIIIPKTDDEAVMWRNSLLDVKRAYGYLESGKFKDALGSGVFISRGSTFSTHRDNEELLRNQIESCVIFSANLQDWDGKKWIPKYFVLTTSRVLILSLALHLYDEEPDLIGSFATKNVVEVRSCNQHEEVETGLTKSAFVVITRQSYKQVLDHSLSPPSEDLFEKIIIRCDSFDNCLEWMRFLCHSNGKLELKKNAATGIWGSVNRIATMSRHQSFLLKNNVTIQSPNVLAQSDGFNTISNCVKSATKKSNRKRISRHDATRRRTSELLMSRKFTKYKTSD